jgi:DNA-cytosine methyltransferase
MRYLSVCSGIEAASVAWHPLGWEAVGFAEIDKFPSRVLAHHYPDVPNFGDFTTIDTTKLGRVDLLVGGTPCQDFSVAGLRAGLDGDRGNLTLEFLKLADRAKPRWIVWENVPGVISDKTDALKHFMDGLEELGYVVDIDILDAQFFGLAQRRRRVFVCAQRVHCILNGKTASSALTIAQCLTESLALTLAVLRNQSATGYVSSALKNGKPRDSLQRRMKLFGLHSEEIAPKLLESLDVLHRLSARARSGLASVSGSVDMGILEATKSSRSSAETDPNLGGCLSTEPSWNGMLGECLQTMRSCITSTPAKEITESKIYTCSQMVLRISGLITQSMHSSPSFWSAVSSTLTALKEFTEYARSASSDLFGDMGWIHDWRDFIEQAEQASASLENLTVASFEEVLPFSKSMYGNSPPRRETRQDIAPTIAARTQGGGGLGTDFDCDGGLIPSQIDYETETMVAHSLRADGFDASEDGTGRGTPIVPVCFDACQSDVIQYGDMTGPLDTDGHTMAVAFAENSRAELRLEGGDGQIVSSLKAGGGKPGQSYPAIAQAYDIKGVPATNGASETDVHTALRARAPGHSEASTTTVIAHQWAVRRLTPTECARLQGFPDQYLDLPGAADGPKYKALGNSFAVPVVAWLGKRIAACG